ncbi:FCD domain-containing protein [Pseudactinotalea sp. HY160]|uniref:GntR family transcriptional regulator n=1 Tax=Pseudactinotalea sp. HY160 TaxID=2654490 RepID=UPI00128B295C|nr:GntR family transcriptional regulator [Pseudactinotalea sp. HY160]MPV50397.1 FCD domain-containing protein [Pseudactinotalea sp. HY160]
MSVQSTRLYREERPLRDIVAEGLRSQIYNGLLAPGTRLIEREIAAEFDVSRLPVREALRALANEGLVEHLTARGMSVCQLSHRQVSELYDVREVLEQLAARQAADRVALGAEPLLDVTMREVNDAVAANDIARAHVANSRFHDEIVQLSGNELLAQTLEPLMGRLSWLRRKIEDFDLIRAEHDQIAAAIAAGDVEGAGAAADAHVRASRRRTLAFLYD